MEHGGKRHEMRGRVVTARGARAVERRLLADVRLLLEPLRESPEGLAAPVRVIVSSRSLREHLLCRLVQELGPALVGVSVHTLRGVAREILDRCGCQVATADWVFEVVVRRAAAGEPLLARPLEPLQDAFGPVVASVRDLLSAGLPQGEVARLDRRLGELPDELARERARAILRVAERTLAAMAAADLSRGEDSLAAAALCLREHARTALPARAVLVHGFADATGLATQLIAELIRQRSALVYLDRPDDPARPDHATPGEAFVARFRRRLGESAELEEDTEPPPPSNCHVFDASGTEGEIAEVAYRVRALLDRGEEPEGISVVARRLEPYAVALRRRFAALGIPFSGGYALAALDPQFRRWQAALRVLELGDEANTEHWLDGCGVNGPAGESGAALSGEAARRELRRLGLERVRDVARWGETDGIAGLAVAARGLTDFLRQWPRSTTLAEHLTRFGTLCRTLLGWEEAPSFGELSAAHFEVTREEFGSLLRSRTGREGALALGGNGGGVRVLDVVHARATTHRHLFLMGLNRNVFPRIVREDVLLPDRIRRVLLDDLPDLALKRAGHDEERFLFAELVSSAAEVTLSWQRTDEDGVLLSSSPLVDRMRLSAAIPAPVSVPRLRQAVLADAPEMRAPRLRTACDSLLHAGLQRARSQVAPLLALALEEVRARFYGALWPATVSVEALADMRYRLLSEYDPDLREGKGRMLDREPGPYFGFIGPARGGPDDAGLSVTWLERMATCPWQAFLTGRLKLKEPYGLLLEPRDIETRVFGTAVHRALKDLVCSATGRRPRDLASALRLPPAVIECPSTAAMERAALEAVRAVALEEGVRSPGIHAALARRMQPYLQAAFRKRENAALTIVGAELEGSLSLKDSGGRQRQIIFRADRVDREEGRLVLVDFKTGSVFPAVSRESTKEKHLLAGVREGTHLQLAVYAAGAGESSAEGRYLHIDPDVEPRKVASSIRAGSEAAGAALEQVLGLLLEACDAGVFSPRLESVKGAEPDACRSCAVAGACVRGDSGARRRLANIVDRARGELGVQRSVSPEVERLYGLWTLGEVSTDEGVEGGEEGGAR
ncbi:MAG: PD-(D/E)XK nuclease family protein [Planctomycetota bacterium]